MYICNRGGKPLVLLHLLIKQQLDGVLCFTSSVESTHRQVADMLCCIFVLYSCISTCKDAMLISYVSLVFTVGVCLKNSHFSTIRSTMPETGSSEYNDVFFNYFEFRRILKDKLGEQNLNLPHQKDCSTVQLHAQHLFLKLLSRNSSLRFAIIIMIILPAARNSRNQRTTQQNLNVCSEIG